MRCLVSPFFPFTSSQELGLTITIRSSEIPGLRGGLHTEYKKNVKLKFERISINTILKHVLIQKTCLLSM